MLLIIVMVPFNEDEKMRLGSYLFANYLFTATPTKEELKQVDIIIGNPTIQQLKQCENLKWVQLQSAGSHPYASNPFFKSVLLTNASGCYGISVMEHMVGSLLYLFRNFKQYQENQRKQQWEKQGNIRSIHGCNVLVVGLGDVGSTFAKTMYEMGAYTIGIRFHQVKRPYYIDEQYQMNALVDVLPRCDVVALCLPDCKDTNYLFNQEMLNQMKHNAIIISVGNGNVIDLDALATLIQEHQIGGACLDVFDEEPLPSNHPLWELDQVLITPHCAGIWDFKATRNQFLCLLKENLERFIQGKQLLNVMDPESGYRMYHEDCMFSIEKL